MSKILRLKRACLLAILLPLSGITVHAQEPYYNERPEFMKANNVWVFGRNTGLDFSTGSPEPIITNFISNEGSASVSDRLTGDLLFYSDGGRVWNVNQQVMPNGAGLLGNAFNQTSDSIYSTSTSQGVCIVPAIGDPDKYYLFSLRGPTSGWPLPEGTLFYSVVDMSLNNGLGDIVPGQKNIALSTDTLSEAMVAVPGDCNDVWLIVHHATYGDFIAYHITTGGIDTVPVVSNTGYFVNGVGPGCLAISPDRQKIALAMFSFAGFFIGDFNPATGMVTNAILIMDPNPYSVCFSPDNSKLYRTNLITGLTQYDLSTYDSATISSSATVIHQPVVPMRSGCLRLYNDTIYHLLGRGSVFNGFSLLNRINQPNLPGTACDYQQIVQDTLVGAHPTAGFGSEVVFPVADSLYALVLDTVACTGFVLSAPEASTDTHWDDGSSAPDRNITTAGTYWLQYKDECGNMVTDTFIISGMDLIPPMITVDEFILGTTVTYTSYQWLYEGILIAGATNATLTVSENGDYQVIVSNEDGCVDTSAVYTVTNANGINEVHPFADQVSVYPNPAEDVVHVKAPIAVSLGLYTIDGRLIKQAKAVKSLDIGELSKGMYFLQFHDREGRLIKTEKLVK